MEIHQPVPGLNAHRHPSSPIAQPKYTFDQVPHASKSLEGSIVQEITSRDAFKQIMGEMVLLCKEAMKRNKSVKTASKPLGLEYIADRLDVDDPCFGYVVRSKQGHLQGFITVTTFTNWQKNFKWDSLNEVSFFYHPHIDNDDNDDDDESDDNSNSNSSSKKKNNKTKLFSDDEGSTDNDDDDDKDDEDFEESRKPSSSRPLRSTPRRGERRGLNNSTTTTEPSVTTTPIPPPKSISKVLSERERRLSSIAKRPKTKRVIDEDGSLAKELQTTVRLGDPYNEGVVWPRIAEISLLGGLGCGQAMVDLVIEHLEFQRPSPIANYDYIALQATDNSIPFYESRGFIRVGAITYNDSTPPPQPTEAPSSTSATISSTPTRGRPKKKKNANDINKAVVSDEGVIESDSRSSSPAFTETSISTHPSGGGSDSDGTATDCEDKELPSMKTSTPTTTTKLPPNAAPPTPVRSSDIVASPHFQFIVNKPGDTPSDVAKRFKVNVWDLIFLNKDIYPDLRPTSRLFKDTMLYVPKSSVEAAIDNPKNLRTPSKSNVSSTSGAAAGNDVPTKWFIAKENDTPRKIAQKFGVQCSKLVSANRYRLPELQANSRLRKGTKIKVSNLDMIDIIAEPYCHWSFPEDTHVEGGDPSYMMVRRLDRKTARNPRVVRNSLAAPVEKYSPPTMLFPPPPKDGSGTASSSSSCSQHNVPPLHPPPSKEKAAGKGSSALIRFKPNSATKKNVKIKLPKKPTRPAELDQKPPVDGREVYVAHQKELHPEFINETPEIAKIIQERWSRQGQHKKSRYNEIARQARLLYDRVNEEYNTKILEWKQQCKKRQEGHEEEMNVRHIKAVQSSSVNTTAIPTTEKTAVEPSLFNSVVKLRSDALEGKEYKYWYVLTFIPDLKWCHLVPMEQQGVFGPERKRAHGRPRFRLVDEKLALELDISSTYCIPVKARALKKSNDADKEEWDIIDDGKPPTAVRRMSSGNESVKSSSSKTSKKKAVGSSSSKPAPSHKQEPPLPFISSSMPRAPPPKAPRFQVVLSPGKTKKAKKVSKPAPRPKGTSTSEEYDISDPAIRPIQRIVDPLKRTRSSPISETAAKNSILNDGKSGPDTPQSDRKKRRCMRCIESGGSMTQATACSGSKGRFGRDGCEFFDNQGHKVKEFAAAEVTSDSGAESRIDKKRLFHGGEVNQEYKTAEVLADVTRSEVMLDATNRKRKRVVSAEPAQATDPKQEDSHPRKSRRVSTVASYAE